MSRFVWWSQLCIDTASTRALLVDGFIWTGRLLSTRPGSTSGRVLCQWSIPLQLQKPPPKPPDDTTILSSRLLHSWRQTFRRSASNQTESEETKGNKSSYCYEYAVTIPTSNMLLFANTDVSIIRMTMIYATQQPLDHNASWFTNATSILHPSTEMVTIICEGTCPPDMTPAILPRICITCAQRPFSILPLAADTWMITDSHDISTWFAFVRNATHVSQHKNSSTCQQQQQQQQPQQQAWVHAVPLPTLHPYWSTLSPSECVRLLRSVFHSRADMRDQIIWSDTLERQLFLRVLQFLFDAQ